MGIVTGGLSVIAANMSGSSLPIKIAIGTSGLVFASGNTTLGSEVDRNLITSTDLSTTEQVTFVSNFSAPEISGTILKEFGTFTSGNTMLDRQVLAGSLVFDGEQELQAQTTFKFFMSGT